jgi:hypothetical protein
MDSLPLPLSAAVETGTPPTSKDVEVLLSFDAGGAELLP